MNKLIATLVVTIAASFSVSAQEYEATLEDRKLMFQDYYYLKDWQKVLPNLEYIIQNSPNEGEKYYIKGVRVYDNLIKGASDKTEITKYQTRSLNLYKQRINIYGSTPKVENQYLSANYRYWIKTPAKYDSLQGMFEQRLDLDVNAVSPSNCLAYFDVLRRAKRYNSTLDEDKILTNYDKITASIKTKGDERGYVDKIDKMLFETIDLDCARVEEIYGQDISELDHAKRYLNMVFKMDCEVNDKAEQALDVVLENEPEFKLAIYAAKKSLIDNRLSDAEKYLGIALGIAENKNEEGAVYLQLAKTMTLKNQKQQAHKYAKQSIAKNNNKEAYSLIGNLYMASFMECIGEKDIVARRAVFIAAYDKFKMANDTKNMKIAAAQFPTMEEIHFNSYELGQSVVVNCWFKEEVLIAKRVGM